MVYMVKGIDKNPIIKYSLHKIKFHKNNMEFKRYNKIATRLNSWYFAFIDADQIMTSL